MDTSKIIDSLMIAAIIGLVTAVVGLNTSVADLSKQIAVMEERQQMTTKEWSRRGAVVDDLVVVVRQQGERIIKLEWTLDQ